MMGRPPTPPAPDYKALFESAPGLYLVLTPELRIVAASDAYLRATMTRREEVVGRLLFDVFPDNPDDPAATGVRNLKASLERVLKEKVPDMMAVQKYDIRRPDSEGGGFEERHWSPINSPVLGSDGTLSYIIHRVEDVTDFIRLKQAGAEQTRATEELRARSQAMEAEVFARAQEIQEKNRELRAANEALERLYSKVKELDELKTQFFSNVSHEFRTPLTLMIGPLEEVLSGSKRLPPAVRESLGAAHRNCLRLLKLVNSLLEFSRLEAGKVQASFEPVDLAVLTADLASVFRSAVEKAGLAFDVRCPALPEPVWVDREMWEKVVSNLLSNALKFTFEGSIAVELRNQGKGAELEVRDTGIGIAPEELPGLFERFHRVKGGKARTHEGSGIGLALVKELVRLHGGEVRVESVPGRGTSFFVSLLFGSVHLPKDRLGAAPPAGTPSATARASAEEALHWRPAAASSQPRASARILLADDNADMREYVARILGPHWEVEAVSNGLEALRAARTAPPELVLSDVMMPQMGGVELLRELRQDPRLRTVPVILLSARAGEESRIEGLESGADDYLIKPFSARELVARVRTHLEMARLRRAAETSARELAETRAALLQDLERKNRDLEAYGYSLAHDLGAPLRSITGFAQILQEDFAREMGEEARDCVRKIVESSRRLSLMVQDLLALTRVSRGEFPVGPADLSEIVQECLEQLEGDLRNRGAEVRVPSEPLPKVLGNRTLLCQVVTNLLSNASKFVAPGVRPSIGIRAERIGGTVRLWIEDNGIGIDPRFHEKIFGVFQRLHSDSAYHGSGIGLALVERGMDRMGGRVGVESQSGRGSRFWIELPEARQVPHG